MITYLSSYARGTTHISVCVCIMLYSNKCIDLSTIKGGLLLGKSKVPVTGFKEASEQKNNSDRKIK